jgi:hypothetical protein
MSNSKEPKGKTSQPGIYQIRIQGHLGRHSAVHFEELNMTLEDDGTTLLIGPVTDQAALFGILRRIRDLGITLISINSIPANSGNSLEIGSGDHSAG